MSAQPEDEQLPGVVNLEEWKKSHSETIAQHTADATQEPVSPQEVQSPQHDLNDHHSASQFEIINPDKVKEAEVKIPDAYRTPVFAGSDSLTNAANRLITKVGFSPSNKFFQIKKYAAQKRAEAHYGKGAKVVLVEKKGCISSCPKFF